MEDYKRSGQEGEAVFVRLRFAPFQVARNNEDGGSAAL